MKFTFLLLLVAIGLPSSVHAQRFSLGSAQRFAVLGGSAVTNNGPTVVNGDLGVNPGTSVTGFPPGTVTSPSAIYAGGTVAQQAQADVTTSYNALAGMTLTQDLTGQDLGGLTLTPGTYRFATSAQLTGTLTLDYQGADDALFVFQIGSTLTTASNSGVQIINGGNGSNVFWQVGSSATLGTMTDFTGSILASQSITLNTGATVVNGRVLARNGIVTLDTNALSIPNSAPQNGAPGTFGAAGVGAPEPSSLFLLASMGLPISGLLMRRRAKKSL